MTCSHRAASVDKALSGHLAEMGSDQVVKVIAEFSKYDRLPHSQSLQLEPATMSNHRLTYSLANEHIPPGDTALGHSVLVARRASFQSSMEL